MAKVEVAKVEVAKEELADRHHFKKSVIGACSKVGD